MGVISNGTTLLDAGALDSGVATGAMTLIKTITASSDSTISFVHGASSVVLDSTYPIYLFKFIGIHPGTSNADLGILASTDTGSSYGVATTSTFFDSKHRENDTLATVEYITAFDSAQSTSLVKITGSIANDKLERNWVDASSNSGSAINYSSGPVGINKPDIGAYKLWVVGHVRLTNLVHMDNTATVTNLTVNGTFTNNSDSRAKLNQELYDTSNCLHAINNISIKNSNKSIQDLY